MSTVIDEKIVSMQFDNKQFQNGAKDTISTLDRLKEALNKNISADNFEALDKAAKKIDLSGIETGVQKLADRFSTLGIIGMRVIENITDGLMNQVTKAVHFATDAIVSGGVKRAMNIENAHFQLQGLISDEKEVQKIMDDAMDSVDGTAYAYDEAAKAASMFAATGLKSGQEMQMALKGIAGVAATTNSDYESLSNIFTTIAGQGKVMAMQLNQLATRGMNAAASLTDYFNKVNKGEAEASDSVKAAIKDITGGLEITEAELREFVSDGEISFEIFSEAMGRTFGDHAKDANETFTGAMANIRAAFARTGAMFITPLIEQSGEMVQLFNAIREKVNALNGSLKPLAETVTQGILKFVPKVTDEVKKLDFGFTEVRYSLEDWEDKLYGFLQNRNFKGNIYESIYKSGDIKAAMFTMDQFKEKLKEAGVDISKYTDEQLSEMRTKTEKHYKEITDVVNSDMESWQKHMITNFQWHDEMLSKAVNYKEMSKSLEDALTKGTDEMRKVLYDWTDEDMWDEIEGLSDAEVKKRVEWLKDYSDNVIETRKDVVHLSDSVQSFYNVLGGFGNIGKAILSVLKPITEAFKEVFTVDPKGLVNATESFKNFTAQLKLSDEASKGVKEAFKIIFELFKSVGNLGASIFQGLFNVLKQVADAAKMFGNALALNFNFNTTSILGLIKYLTELINKFAESAKTFKLSEEHLDSLRKVFKGVYGIVLLLGEGIVKLVGYFINLITGIKDTEKPTKSLSDIFFELVGRIGDALFGFVEWVRNSDVIKSVFEGIGTAVAFVKDAISGLIGKIKGLNSATKETEESGKKFEKLSKVFEFFKEVAGKVGKVLSPVVGVFKKLGSALLGVLKSVDPIKAFFSLLNGVLLTGIIYNFKKIQNVVKNIESVVKKTISGPDSIMTEISNTLKALQTNINAMTRSINAGVLKDIAAGVLMLAGAMLILSTIDGEALGRSLGAVTVLLGELTGVLIALNKLSSSSGGTLNSLTKTLQTFRKGSMATTMIKVAAAVLVLTIAVKNLSKLSWEELGKGLLAVTVLLGELVLVMKAIDKLGGPAKLGSIGTGLMLVAVAVLILTKAVQKLSSFSWDELLKGLVAVGALLLELAAFTKLVGGSKNLMSIGAGLLMVSSSVLILYKAVKGFADLDWEQIKKGLVGVGGVLLELAGFTMLAGGAKNMISIGIGMVLLGEAIKIVYDSFVGFANLSWEKIGKGVTAMGAVLGEMVLALDFTTPKAILPAGGLWILADAIKRVAPSFMEFGNMSWSEIGKAATGMGAALAEMVLALDFTTPAAVLPGAGLWVLTEAIKNVFPTFAEFGGMSWSEIGKAATGMGSALAEMVLALDFTTPAAILPAGGMWVLTEAIQNIYPAFSQLGTMSWSEIGRAATAMGAALGEMVLALDFTTPAAILPGAGIWILADALEKIAPSFVQLGKMEWDEIGRAATAMLAAIGELAGLDAILGIFSGAIVLGAGAFETAVLALYGASKMLPGITQNVVTAINNINTVNSKDFQNGLKRIGKAITTLGDSLKHFGLLAPNGAKALKTTAEGIKTLVNPIKQFNRMDPKELSRSFDILSTAFGKFGDALHNFGLLANNGANAMLTVADALNKLWKPMLIFSNLNPIRLSMSFDVLATAFGNFGDSLHEFGLLSGIGADAMVKVSDAINKLAPAMVLLQNVNPLKMALDLAVLSNAFKAFGESLDGFGLLDTIKADAILDLAEAVGQMSPALVELSEIPQTKLESILNSLGEAFKAFGEALDATPFWNPKGRAEGIGALIDNIAKLSEVLPPFLELDQEKAATALETLGSAFQAFGQALDATPFWNPQGRAEGIGALIENIPKLTEVLPGFMELDPDGTKTALETIAAGFTGFGEALDATPFWGVKDRGAAISTLVSSIGTLTDGVKQFLTIESDADAVKESFTTIADGFSKFGKSLNAAPLWNADDRGEGIKILVGSIKKLVGGVKEFLTIEADSETVKEILKTIGKAFKSFGEAISKAPLWNSEDRANSIVSLVEQIDTLADGVQKICDIESDDVTNVLDAIGTAFKDFGSAIKESPLFSSKDRAEAIGVVVGHIQNLVEPIQTLALIKTDVLVTVIGGLINLINSLGGSLDNFKWSEDKSNTFKSMVDSIVLLSGIDTTKLFNAVNEVERLRKLCEGLAEIKISNLNAFSAALGNTAKLAISTFTDTFNNSKPKLNSTLNVFMNAAINAIKSFDSRFDKTGFDSASKFVEGVLKGRENAQVVGNAIALRVIRGLEQIYPQMESAGRYVVEGFTRGIRNNLRSAEDAGRSLGNAAYEAARRALDEHSPSKKMGQVGSYAGEGFVNSLYEWVKAAVQAGEELGYGATDGLNDAISNVSKEIQNGKDLTPVITPVLNLDNLKKEADQIGGIIDISTPIALANNASVSFSGGISKMFDDLEASLPENSNDDIVEAVDKLNANMINVMNRLGQLQVVLDSGVLVGELSEPIDKVLGFNSVLSERGVR